MEHQRAGPLLQRAGRGDRLVDLEGKPGLLTTDGRFVWVPEPGVLAELQGGKDKAFVGDDLIEVARSVRPADPNDPKLRELLR